MKLIELEIRNVRGIRDLKLHPQGKNLVVWGPNGTGKSAVIDAIDFLLTGSVSRLTGKGTGNLSLAQHGPHVDQKPEDAIVRGVIQLPGSNQRVKIERCMASPKNLVCEPKASPLLQSVTDMAKRGQHVLTRREILQYITAEAGSRAQQIQSLLNINDVELIRQAFVRVNGNADKALQNAQSSVRQAEGAVNATTQQASFQLDVVLQMINDYRLVLQGTPVADAKSVTLKSDLHAPVITRDDNQPNLSLLEKDLENLRSALNTEKQAAIAQCDTDLRSLVAKLQSTPDLMQALNRQTLIKLGIELLDESGNCPLCNAEWQPHELANHLTAQLGSAQLAKKYLDHCDQLSKTLADFSSRASASIDKVVAAIRETTELVDQSNVLGNWQRRLKQMIEAATAYRERYTDVGIPQQLAREAIAPSGIDTVLHQILATIQGRLQKTSPEQNAWDTLTRLEENFKVLEAVKRQLAEAILSKRKANALVEQFQKSRDQILGKLYANIRDRFVTLYRDLHGKDEEGFSANLQPDGAGLNLEVDFHGRGVYPPHALHSEGHQDSMGLCLYLALSEYLTSGLIDLVLLDDVVMSVDADHRRELCRVLSTAFPNRQFVITTHDRTWANQLKTEGVVSSKEAVEFYKWHVDTGPHVHYEVDLWKQIQEDLDNNDVPSASAKLRRGAEEFFDGLCDVLRAQVTYKRSGRWELGDLMPGAFGQFKQCLKQAKRAAQSWKDEETLQKLGELDSTSGQVYTRTNAEQWAVNASVHYNEWANMTPTDFQPVVEAFQDLFSLFTCAKCGGTIYLLSQGMAGQIVRCRCNGINWNLVEQGKQK